jgi:hypothetical protein
LLGVLFGSDTVSPSNHLFMTCFSTFFSVLYPAFLALNSAALYYQQWRPLCSSMLSVTTWMHCCSQFFQNLHSYGLLYFLHFCYCSCDFLSIFILPNYYKYEKRFLDVFHVVSLGDILKLWLRSSLPLGSVGDSQPVDTHVPSVCPLSHLDREDGGSMFFQIGDKQPTSTWCRNPQNRINMNAELPWKLKISFCIGLC